MADQDQLDALGIKTALERMLGRNLSPEASNNLAPASSVPMAQQPPDENGIPFSLSAQRNPETNNEQQAPPPKDDSNDDESDKDQESNSDEQAPISQDAGAEDDASQEKAPARQSLDFGKASPENALAKALAAQGQAMKDAQFQRGIEQLGGGIAKIAPNYSNSDIMRQSANTPIQNYLLQNQEAANDPNSGISKGLRAYMSKLGMDVSDGATANQLKQVMPFIFKDVEAKQAQQARKEDLAEKLAERQQEAQYRNENLKLQKEALAQNKEQTRQDKLSHQSDQATKDAVQMLETARGSKDIQNAKEAIRNVDNAQSLLSEYPDLNKMPQAQASLLVQEISKIAKGGVSGDAEYREIMPSTVASHVMNGLSKLGNKPTGSELGAFLKEYQPYLDTIKTNSANLVNARNSRILDANRKRLGEENYNMLKSTYGEIYGPDQKKLGAGIQLPPDAQSSAQAEIARRLAAKQSQGQ